VKSIKPGRGPSGMSFIGSIIAMIFGVFWTIMAISVTTNSPFGIVGIIFPFFGVMFIIIGGVQAVYNFKNATGKNRYSIFDITDSEEERDPSDKWIKNEVINEGEKEGPRDSKSEVYYCPYCGVQIKSEYMYCPKCGKAINKV